jgi:hypothetical protein
LSRLGKALISLNLLALPVTRHQPARARRATVARSDPVFITREIETAPFPSAPNVVVAFPHREDWWNRYPALRTAYGRKHTIDQFEWLYRDEKRLYQQMLFKRLGTIGHSATGRAVFTELRMRPSYSVYIFPWDFIPSIDGHNPTDLGETERTPLPRGGGRGVKAPKHLVRGWSFPSLDKPGSVDVFYSDERCEVYDADGVLVHELAHAMRVMSGAHHKSKMRRGYPNSEEFCANTIEMMYRSERGLAVTDYRYHSIDQASVLKDPQARAFLTELRYKQYSLFLALAKVDAPFNPIRPIADKLLTIDL